MGVCAMDSTDCAGLDPAAFDRMSVYAPTKTLVEPSSPQLTPGDELIDIVSVGVDSLATTRTWATGAEAHHRELAAGLAELGLKCRVSSVDTGTQTAEELANSFHLARNTACDRVAALGPKADGTPPALAIISVGAKDLDCGRNPQAIFNDLCRVHGAVHALGVPTVALLPVLSPSAAHGKRDIDRKFLVEMALDMRTRAPLLLGVVNMPELIPPAVGSQCFDTVGNYLSRRGLMRLGRQLAPVIHRIVRTSGFRED